MNAKPVRLLLVGGGKMGTAMLAGWKKSAADLVIDVVTPHPAEGLRDLCDHVMTDIADCTKRPSYDVIVLAVKPGVLDQVAPGLAGIASPETVFVSLLTGKTLQTLQDRLGDQAAIIRAMPNTPALIGQGMTVCVQNAAVSPAQNAVVSGLLSTLGDLVWITDEEQMHAVTALSGSGPAYVFALIEALQQAGQSAGLPAELALHLAVKTVQGSGQLTLQSDHSPAELRQQVTSPNGTTQAALYVLQAEQGGLDELIQSTLNAAIRRSQELATE